MEMAGKFLWVLAASSLWLAGSGLVLWLCLRSRLQLSPSTRAVVSMLVVLQGWIWIGIPVQVDSAWIPLDSAGIQSQTVSSVDPVQPAISPHHQSTSSRAASSLPRLIPIVSIAVAAIWAAGIVILLWRSICGIIALSRMVRALPSAPEEWQQELAMLCGE